MSNVAARHKNTLYMGWRRLGHRAAAATLEIAAGVPVLRAVGAKDGDMLLALKSGNFGGPEFFSDALQLMR